MCAAAADDVLLTPPPPVMTDRRDAAAPDSMAASHQRHFRDVYIFVYSFLKFLRQLIISISDVKTDRL